MKKKKNTNYLLEFNVTEYPLKKLIKTNRMKRQLLFICIMLGIFQHLSAQSITISENFDTIPVSFISSQNPSWKIDTNYFVSHPNGYLGTVPNKTGDTIILTTPVYNLKGYGNVKLQFSHICKVSTRDIVRIEYKIKSRNWQAIPPHAYMGNAWNYGASGFNATNYNEWNAIDSLALPMQSWWKEELFDVSGEVGDDDEVQFRFLIIHGNIPGTQAAYGWLLDNVKITASVRSLPVVELLHPYPMDTVSFEGPYAINARIKSTTTSSINKPWLKYTHTFNGISVTDSSSMKPILGDSLWRDTIPQFPAGTDITYTIMGSDTIGNDHQVSSNYVIRTSLYNYGGNSAALIMINSPVSNRSVINVAAPVTVTIQNKGDSVLKSVSINWSVNGIIQSYAWTGNLYTNFRDVVTIGSHTPRPGMHDTVIIWLNMPNGYPDAVPEDDTLGIITYGCDPNLRGTYIVGVNGHFPDLQSALHLLSQCSATGDITLSLESGIYTENWDISNTNKFMGGHTLTITSQANHKDSVLVTPLSGTGININNVDNLVIHNLTVDASISKSYCIYLTDICSDITIEHCRLLADTVSDTSRSAGICSKIGFLGYIYIKNNIITGGAYGIDLSYDYQYDGNSRRVYIDSNIINNSYYSGINLDQTNFFYITYNTITSYLSKGSSWHGIDVSRSSNSHNIKSGIIGNRVYSENPGITSGITGINIYGGNLILTANNEISIHSNAEWNTTGISIYHSDLIDIVYNTVLLTGPGGQVFNALDYTTNPRKYNRNIVEGNIFIANGGITPYAVYTYLNIYLLEELQIDNNNYYSSGDIGFVKGIKATLDDWKATMAQDMNSVNISPDFIDSTINLELSNYEGLECIPISGTVDDIDGNLRIHKTTMGCYHAFVHNTNAMLKGEENQINTTPGAKDAIKVELLNTALSPLTTAIIQWSLDGVLQSPVAWSGLLTIGQSAIIELGQIDYIPGDYHIKAWIDNIGSLQDEFPGDDTLNIFGYGCSSPLNGIYTIGINGDFESIDRAFTVMNSCGIRRYIQLNLEDGIYRKPIDLMKIENILTSADTLVITSASGNTQDVIMETRQYGIRTGKTENIAIKDITINLIGKGTGILINDSCSNLEINGCIINLDTAATGWEGYTGIENEGYNYMYSYVQNIRILNNYIKGGLTGIQLYGGWGCSEIQIDNNNFKNRNEGINLSSCTFVNITNNAISSLDSTDYWRGISCFDCTINEIFGNKIHSLSSVESNIGAINLSDVCQTTNLPCKLYNNEIVIKNNIPSSYSYGIKISNSFIDCYHNSIYISGQGAQGIEIDRLNTNNHITVKNNSIVMESADAFPIYINATGNLSLYDMDYNNMYAPAYVGYVEEAKATIPDWQQVITTDQHSKSTYPDFINVDTSLEPENHNHLFCPAFEYITKDILNRPRSGTTIMGAYSVASPAFDPALEKIYWGTEIIQNGQQVPVYVTALNLGDTVISDITLGWSVNNIPQLPATYAPGHSLEIYEKADILLGTFTANLTDTFLIKAWIIDANSLQDTNTWNDTVSASARLTLNSLLAWFEAPLIPDTVHSLSLDIHTKIIEGTGATLNTPEMHIQTRLNSGEILHDTISMDYIGQSVWLAHVPPQYYDSKLIYTLDLTDTAGHAITLIDSTYLEFIPAGEKYAGYNLSIVALEKFGQDSALCSQDYTSVKITLANTGTKYYDFSLEPVVLSMEVTNPIPFNKDTVLATGDLFPGETMVIEVTNILPIIIAGRYDIKTWINSPLDNVIYDDTLLYYYISGKFGLPVDENFSNGLPMEFVVKTNNPPYEWDTISQGIRADTAVRPQFGTKMLAFSGTQGTMSTLSTRQLDLSQTIQPTLSFWYFHDTIPCEDYTDVRITVDGGETYTTLFELTKYNAVYGWKEYNMDLPPFAVNQCVILVFEAMEKSRNGNITQYIDRILITAKQEIAITDVFTPDLSLCDMKNKEWKVVLSNKTAPALDYNTTPVAVTLELIGTSYRFTDTISSGMLHGFSSDTVTIGSGIDLAPGKYIIKTYISSIFWEAFMDTLIISPDFNIRIHNISNDGNPALAAVDIKQQVTIKNTGNMPLPQLDLILSVDATDISPAYHFTTTESTGNIIQPGDSVSITFNNPYKTPWCPEYRVHILAYLHCDTTIIRKEAAIPEYVNIDNLALININKPSGQGDTIGTNINIEVMLENKSDVTYFSNIAIYARIEDSKGNIKADISETISKTINTLDTASHVFSSSYTVPADSVYYITVFIEKQDKDNYRQDDTIRIKRTTNYNVGIVSIDPTTIRMYQNIPNPANNSTSITYRIPESGEVIFTVSSINGQVLYNKSVKSAFGIHTIDINVSHLAAGIYFYSMEFNGQRITKRMSIKR